MMDLTTTTSEEAPVPTEPACPRAGPKLGVTSHRGRAEDPPKAQFGGHTTHASGQTAMRSPPRLVPSMALILTEFIDPTGVATYFRLPDLTGAVDDELMSMRPGE